MATSFVLIVKFISQFSSFRSAAAVAGNPLRPVNFAGRLMLDQALAFSVGAAPVCCDFYRQPLTLA
jgi:hypothetical protein